MNQRMARCPIFMKMTFNPGFVNPSNNPKIQRKRAHNEISKNFFFSTLVD